MQSFSKFADKRPLEQAAAWAVALLLAAILLWAVLYALLYSLGGIGFQRSGWTIAHWRDAVSSGHLLWSLLLSGSVAGMSVMLATGIALALVLHAPRFWQRSVGMVVLSLPLAMPIAVIGMVTHSLLSPGGLASRFAHQVGIVTTPQDFPELVNDRYAIGMIVAISYSLVPLLVLYFAQIWKHLRGDRLFFTAQAIGATAAQARWKVLAPAMLYRARSMLALFFLIALGSYEVPLLLGRQSPEMVSVLIQRRSGIYDLADRPVAFALATAYFALTISLLAIWRIGNRAHD